MKILIIGAQGMLGSMLARIFADKNPTLWDRAEIDITNGEEVTQKISALAPRVIINAAAYTNVDGAETERNDAFEVNEHGVLNIAAVAREVDATLVHYSTDYVFPGTQEEGYGENDPAGPPLNVYGESKLAGEQALARIAPRYFLLRTAWLYGPRGKNFVHTMLSLAVKESKVSVVNDQFGSPTFTKDVALATRDLLEGDYQPGIYHTVNAGQASWYEFAREIFVLSEQSVQLEPITSDTFTRPAKRPKYSILKNTKGPRLRPWQEALADYITTYFHT